ncbi:MAG: hypothetical protein CFE43_15010 [Burkholderiales bacterium PBB3]|nr:MAG: hypothetical protein CFE43_15010 [Burkholderiales bacterium PBB3]
MCYSAQVLNAYDEYCKLLGADIDIEAFAQLYGMKLHDNRIKTPRGLDAAIEADQRAEMDKVRLAVLQYKAQQVTQLGEEIIEQQDRLRMAQEALLKKFTKKATEDVRIATNKIGRAQEKLVDLQRADVRASDGRMFPGYFVPVLIMEDGRKIVRPMRYQCRIAGVPENYDTRFPGTYNARMDNLDGFWRNQFGHTHGIAIVSAFYEYVTGPNGQKIVLEFRPTTEESLYVACLWSHWTSPGTADLYSFAFITDDPPPEVLAAGHDRCIVPLKRGNVDYWLDPDPNDLDSLWDILKDKERPYYEHRLAA